MDLEKMSVEELLIEATGDLYHDGKCPRVEAELTRRIGDAEEWKRQANEYGECLQELCMTTLYKHCEPVSHKWPGKKHVECIREGVSFLLAKVERLTAEVSMLVREVSRESSLRFKLAELLIIHGDYIRQQRAEDDKARAANKAREGGGA